MTPVGKHALITGAASGIGRATALRLAAAGVGRLTLLDRDRAGIDEVARLVAAAGPQVASLSCDVSDVAALTAAFDEAAASAPIDMVFNNAGVVTGAPLFPAATTQRIAQVFAINVTGVVLGTQLAIQHMSGRGGVVINTVSTSHDNAGFRDVLYTTSKAAVYQFTRACAQFLEPTGVRVCGISPGLVDTPILDTTGGDRRAEWMTPILANNVALAPGAIADAVLEAWQDDSFIGEVRAVRAE
ncbi:3-oxoacyl-[acyl-carrier protein] reductase [Novosphingobium kunmingense]|uniref:3-oxoacyl-[acyl-carrier protein] reductase n=1 Tax=Novosphingobium kunmingense TaxID=1211806 RepID=A0A2N0H393_9SPHN|nr:SDR family oxidoreductase [Novosphingobium kunmingense]PKB13416.1 3-oxoacyl-[acyl-carrier protein] reductase [Novosphingobium kunmingense]